MSLHAQRRRIVLMIGSVLVSALLMSGLTLAVQAAGLQQATTTASPSPTHTLTPSATPTGTLTPVGTVSSSATITTTVHTPTPSATAAASPTFTPTPPVLPSPTQTEFLPTNTATLPSAPTAAPVEPLPTSILGPPTATFKPFPQVTYQYPGQTPTYTLLALQVNSPADDLPKGNEFSARRAWRGLMRAAPLVILGALWIGLLGWFLLTQIILHKK